MAGKIFYRGRTKIGEGKKAPRYKLVAVAGIDMKVYAKHIRKQELDQIAKEVGADLVELKAVTKQSKDDEVEV
ncbi:MAG: hypothetical protein GY868_06005 [Deltaproteobacteria bacterium]|nr:hypothetical protein [Deltaproteobacteria bacterium]